MVQTSEDAYVYNELKRGSLKRAKGHQQGLLTDAIQPVDGHGLEGPPHHGILFQNLIEIVHGERVQATVSLCTHTGCAPSPSQQADLCHGQGRAVIPSLLCFTRFKSLSVGRKQYYSLNSVPLVSVPVQTATVIVPIRI